jgi:pilus assembly protein CpaC
LPWLGQVPVLGSLFRSARYRKNETDLVIIVTPRLVKPKLPGERIATPHDKLVPGNDRDFFLKGRDEIKRTYNGYMGHIIQIKGKRGHVSYK